MGLRVELQKDLVKSVSGARRARFLPGSRLTSLLLTIGMFCVHVLLSPSSLTLLVLVSTLLAELVRVQLD